MPHDNDEVFRIRAFRTADLEDEPMVALVQLSEQQDGLGRLFSFYVTPEILQSMGEGMIVKAAEMRRHAN